MTRVVIGESDAKAAVGSTNSNADLSLADGELLGARNVVEGVGRHGVVVGVVLAVENVSTCEADCVLFS